MNNLNQKLKLHAVEATIYDLYTIPYTNEAL